MKVCDVVMNTVWFDPRVRKQIAEYQKNNIEVCCVGLNKNRYDEERIKNMPCEVTIVDIDSKYKRKLRNPFAKVLREYKINKVVEKAIIDFKPDIIHANDLDALIPAYAASKKIKCRLIYDSHEICVENYALTKKKIYKKFLGFQEKRIIKKIDEMVCVSNAAAEYFEKKYKIKKPLVVTNCILRDEQVFNTEKNKGFEILNHGMFYKDRGYESMVECTKLLKDFPEIKLAVRGMGTIEKQLRQRVEKLQADNFIFYPPVLVTELIEEAAKSMVGVAVTAPICLNFELSVSNRLFEYLAAGLPVIMSDIPEHRFLNDKYHIGIIIKEDTPEEFAKAAIKLYKDKEFYNECAKNARILSNEINWENEFKKLIDIEKELLQ